MKKYIATVLLMSLGLTATFAQHDNEDINFENYLNKQEEIVTQAYTESQNLLENYLDGIKDEYENYYNAYDANFAGYLAEQYNNLLTAFDEKENALNFELNSLIDEYIGSTHLGAKELEKRKFILNTFVEKQKMLKEQLKIMNDRYKCIAKSSREEYEYYLDEQSQNIENMLAPQSPNMFADSKANKQHNKANTLLSVI